ncbi:MAG: hypothetical protein AAGG55_07440 [Pseudomonadota bacterium]
MTSSLSRILASINEALPPRESKIFRGEQVCLSKVVLEGLNQPAKTRRHGYDTAGFGGRSFPVTP